VLFEEDIIQLELKTQKNEVNAHVKYNNCLKSDKTNFDRGPQPSPPGHLKHDATAENHMP